MENQFSEEGFSSAADEEFLEKDAVSELAEKTFGIKYLYPWQKLVISDILDGFADEGAETKQIVLLPTGAGKSICFLVPSLFLKGATVIIYPLLALMSDQERRIKESGLACVTLKGQQTDTERNEIFAKIKAGTKLILANPEVLQSARLVRQLAECGIEHIAIDEAHCVTEWGDSFRPAYLKLGEVIKSLNAPRVTAFTATASPKVLARMNEILFQGSGRILRSAADRENIHYKVHYAYIKEKAVLKLVEQEEKPLLVFCATRRRAEKMAALIDEQYRQLHPDKKDCVRFYHAGLSKPEKSAVEKWFHPHKEAVMACTCAFGMGVDKKDIKTVIHLDAPKSAEAFIQEAGRGGRDGSIAKSILVWGIEDSERYRTLKDERERVMGDFAEAAACRRQVLLDALGAEKAACRGCDICLGTAEKQAGDAAMTMRFIRWNSGLYTLHDAAQKLEDISFKRFFKDGYMLEKEDFAAILKQLVKSGSIKKGRFSKCLKYRRSQQPEEYYLSGLQPVLPEVQEQQ